MKKTLAGILVLGLVGWLFIPAGSPPITPPAEATPFLWDQDELWRSLEIEFDATRRAGCTNASERIASGLDSLSEDVEWLAAGDVLAGDERFKEVESRLFVSAAQVAACPEHVASMFAIVNQMRSAMKRVSRGWDIDDEASRDRLYRVLYGARMAIEEVVLQGDSGVVPNLARGTDATSQAPSVEFNGVRIHSGDILVSRGGAPVSALIARGNDYPGNFSHIALVHVSEEQEVNVVEAHIEVGVTTSTLEQYLADTKLRIMVLRLDNSIGQMQSDPLLPHRAATAALNEVRERHIPYDFEMHYEDPSKKFCSEVASAPYSDHGVDLWEGLTTMSASGTARWLSALGVTQFRTHGPSDLEYDPKLVIVAEWRNREALFDDHVDNAVIDAMLEGAERGDTIDYKYRYLPAARIAKAYSLLLNLIGHAGPVPEGMGATTALRSKWLEERHAAVKEEVLGGARVFREERGYEPPYWQLIEMARAALTGSSD